MIVPTVRVDVAWWVMPYLCCARVLVPLAIRLTGVPLSADPFIRFALRGIRAR